MAAIMKTVRLLYKAAHLVEIIYDLDYDCVAAIKTIFSLYFDSISWHDLHTMQT